MAFRNEEDKKAYWRENLALLAKLLVIWFIVSFGAGIIFVDILNEIQFFGFKLGFWFAQQGSICIRTREAVSALVVQIGLSTSNTSAALMSAQAIGISFAA